MANNTPSGVPAPSAIHPEIYAPLTRLLDLIDAAAALDQPPGAPSPEVWIERILKASMSVRTALEVRS